MQVTNLMKTLAFLTLSTSVFAQYSATSTHFVPLPMNSDRPWQLSTLVNMTNRPSLELELGAAYHIGAGFDVGFGVHGGGISNPGSGVMGLDLMFRFLKKINDSVFLGIQTEAGYVYTGLGDNLITPNYGSALPVNLGVVVGGGLQETLQMYFAPTVELGQTMKGGDPVWKSGVGLRFTVGTAVQIADSAFLIIEMRPKISDLTADSAFSTFGVDGGLGVLWEL